MAPEPKDWMDVLQALATPAIAVAGLIIAWAQWSVNRARLRHELFEKRYRVYEALRRYVSSIMAHGNALPEAQAQFLANTAGAGFLFNGVIRAHLHEVWQKSLDLECIISELNGLPIGEARSAKCRMMYDIKTWFVHEPDEADAMFEPFLNLGKMR